MNRLVMSLLTAAFASSSANACAAYPLRPPNGTYVYSMAKASGQTIFKSTIVVRGKGSTFEISETTKLPNGPIATTKSTWSSATLLPRSFQVHQGKIALRAEITPAAVTFIGIPISFGRIPRTSYVIPSVGLIANSLMLAYAVLAHPGESVTLAEVQNNQTVLIRPTSAVPAAGAHAGDVAITVTKDERYGDSADREQIVLWINRKAGTMDGGVAHPGDVRITLLSFTPEAADR